jgi:transcriptional regulator with XRE-family HTH domain
VFRPSLGLDHPETILMSKEPEPRARRRTVRRVVDWHQAAELLAQGMTTAAVADRVGCSRAALARRRRDDAVFQTWMTRCRAAAAEPDDHRLADLSLTLHEAIEKEVRAGNVRVILWLADRLKLVTPPSERTPERELRQILGGLTSDELSEFEQLRDAP